MPTFITTVKFTQQGIKNIGESTKRAAAIKAAAKRLGAKVTSVYWTMGEHDGVLIFEAPDGETAAALMAHVGSLGNVHTSTTRAYDAAEMDAIVAKALG